MSEKMEKDRLISSCPKVTSDFFYIGGTLVIAFILFWFLFPIYSYDSSWYLTYLEYFSGNRPLSEWNPIRGFTFPAILWIAHIIKPGSWGVEIVLCFFYMLWGYYLFNILRFIKKNYFHKKLNIYDCILIFVFALMSSILWGYFHFVLTECISVSLQTMFAYYAIKFYADRKNQCASKIEYSLFALLSCIMTVLFWYLKQSFVANTLLLIAAFELLIWIDKLTLKKILYSLVLMICIAGSLKFSSVMWNKAIETEDSSTSYFANRFNLLRYIVVTSRYNGGTVSVMSDDWEIIDTFEYTQENSYSGALKFLGTCLIRYPDRVLRGYVDNYLLMADLYQNIYRDDIEEYQYTYGPVERNRIWETISGHSTNKDISGEHVALIRSRLRNAYNASKEMEQNCIVLEGGGYGTTFLKDYANVNTPNFLTSFLASDAYWSFTMVIYSTLLVAAPFILVVCFIFCVLRKNSIVDIFFSLSFYAFFFIVMHVVESMPIDRYAVPAYNAMLFIFIIAFSALGEKIRENVRHKGN